MALGSLGIPHDVQRTEGIEMGRPGSLIVAEAVGQFYGLLGMVQGFPYSEMKKVHVGGHGQGTDLLGYIPQLPGNSQSPGESLLGAFIAVF